MDSDRIEMEARNMTERTQRIPMGLVETAVSSEDGEGEMSRIEP